MKSFSSLRSMFVVAMFAVAFAGYSAIAQTPPTFVQVPYINVAAGNITSAGASSPSTAASSCTTGLTTTSGASYGDGCAANESAVDTPWGTATDAWGNVYFGDEGHDYLRVIYGGLTTSNGVTNPATAMIEAANATHSGLVPVAGDVYAMAGGLITTLSEANSTYYCSGTSGTVALSSDGSGCPATQSYIKGAYGGVVDSEGNVFVLDKSNSIVYVVLANTTGLAAQLVVAENLPSNPSLTTSALNVGSIYAIAGGTGGGYVDGALATAGQIHAPEGIAVDANDSLYIADLTNNAVRMINGPATTSGGVGPGYIHTIMGGSCTSSGCTALSVAPANGSAALGAELDEPEGIAVDGSGNVYVADNSAGSPKTVPSTIRVIYAGGSSNPLGNLICLENSSISSCPSSLVTGDVYTIAGGGTTASDNSATGNGALATSTAVEFDRIQGVALDAQGNVYIADYGSHSVIAELNAATGYLTYLAGDGQTTFAPGDFCTAATGSTMTDDYGDGCPGPQSIADHVEGNPSVDASGNIYFADNGDSLVRQLTYNSTKQSIGTFPSTAEGTSAPAQNLAFELLTGAGATQPATNVAVSILAPGGGSSTEFTDEAAGDTCTNSMTLTGASSAATSSPDSVCEVPVIFSPAQVGARTGTLQISATINSVSQTYGTAALSGVGLSGSVPPGSVLTTTTLGNPTPTAPIYGQSVSITVTVAATSGSNTPTGDVVFTVDGTAGTAVALTNGSYTLTLPSLIAGAHTVSATYAGGGDFAGSSTTTSTTITVTPLAITATATNPTTTVVYGQAIPSISGSLNGVLSGDSGNVTADFAVAASLGSPVGSYPVTVSLAGSAAANYTVTLNGTPTLSITPLTVTLTVANANKVYGAALPTFSGSINGVLTADLNDVAGVYSTTATSTSVVTTTGYPITATGLSGSASGNYKLGTVTPGTLTITPIALTTTATPVTVTLGATIPTITGTALSGVLTADQGNVTAVFTTTATSSSPVGTYPISVSLTGSAAPNYTVSLTTPAVVTVQGLTVTVVVSSATSEYGAAIPTLMGVINGLQPADVGNVSANYSTTATSTSAPGTYPITATALTGSAAGNYKLGTVTAGTLTMTTATTTTALTASASSVAEGTTVSFTATVTSSTTGTPSGSVTFYSGTNVIGTVTLSSGVATVNNISLPSGTQSITAAYVGNTDYAASTSPAVSESVVVPEAVPTASSNSVSISSGGNATDTLTITAQGGYTGTATYSCAELPVDMTCSFAPPTATFTTTSTTATTVLTISTKSSTTAMMRTPAMPGSRHHFPMLAMLFPGAFLGFLGFRKRKKSQGWQRLMMFVIVCASLAGLAGITGCGSSGNGGGASTPAGTYTIEVQVTAGTVQSIPLTITVQ